MRGESRLIRNSVAIQTGLDPSTASVDFSWREAGEPTSFFPEQDDLWFWPGDGERVGAGLLIFLMAIRASDGGLGFDVGIDASALTGAAAENDARIREALAEDNQFQVAYQTARGWLGSK